MRCKVRKYSEETKKKLKNIRCNKCGKEILVENGIAREGVLSISYGWGYFSDKDGQTHYFDMCEKCYDNFVKSFLIPIDVKERNEIV